MYLDIVLTKVADGLVDERSVVHFLRHRDLEEELGVFDLTRRQIGRILTASPPEAWERTGIVGDRGSRTVNQMINGAVEHLAHHLRFIIEKRRALSID